MKLFNYLQIRKIKFNWKFPRKKNAFSKFLLNLFWVPNMLFLTLFFQIFKRLHSIQFTKPFLRLEAEFAQHYYDAETSASFLQPLHRPQSSIGKREASAVENYHLIMENAQINHSIMELSCYYFSFLLLSQSNNLNSSTSLNELIEESARNFSSDSISSFVEFFEGKNILKFKNSAKILFFPKDKVFIQEGTKIAGIFLILQGGAKIESEDKHQKALISSGRFIGIPTTNHHGNCIFLCNCNF